MSEDAAIQVEASPLTDRDADPADSVAAEETATPLLAPVDGVPEVVSTPDGVRSAAELLASGFGPLAVDAERASGFRYSQRAYLLQFRRAGAGTVLLDPISVPGDLAILAGVINPLEWVLHSADQDLPGLAELGLEPAALYDTELAGRLAGFERVGLAAMVERTLGLALQKGHGAADWSTRPLPATWLNYAALDVEVLLELRDAMAAELDSQGKTGWAAQEFEHIRVSGSPKPKSDRWRRISGIHAVKSPRTLAAVRELWTARDELARKRDVAPSRVLPDSAIVAAATADPRTTDALRALPVFGGPKQRRSSAIWLQSLRKARDLSSNELPPLTQPFDGPPPVSRWSRRNPDAAERLGVVRAAMAELSDNVSVPVENLLLPDLLRRLVWDWTPSTDEADEAGDESLAERTLIVGEQLRAGGAREWQLELVVPVVAEALAPPACPEPPTQVTDE